MAHRTFRLSVSPEDLPEVRRVLDFDGRSSLTLVHQHVARAFELPVDKALYAFFLSGRFWDAATAYIDPRAEGRRADQALLFRLGLKRQKTFAYLLGFEHEKHFMVEVLAVSEAAEPLATPLLVESVGELQQSPPAEPSASEHEPPELTALVTLAEAYLDIDDELEPFADRLAAVQAHDEPWHDDDAAFHELSKFKTGRAELSLQELEPALPLLRAAATAAERLVEALAGSVQSFLELDEWLIARALGPRLLELPTTLSRVGEVELALSLARAMVFIDPELLQGDIALILARAGRREEALAQLERNLTGARDAALVEAKAGDVYRALGDAPAAEAYYRRSLVEAKTATDRLHALLRLVTCLTEAGRDAEANDLLQKARKERTQSEPEAPVGRNEPCPCGSGKKYKKCHGA